MRNTPTIIFLLPFVLALIVSWIVYLLIPGIDQKYEIRVKSKSVLSIDNLVYYLDLDNDGLSEKVLIKDYQAAPVVEIYNNDGAFINSWTQSGKRVCRFQFMYGDYDQNGLLELYVLTEENDSIVINWLEPFKNDDWRPSKMFVCSINKVMDGCDYTPVRGELADLNNDGKKEVIFIINNGYGIEPRSLFAADIYNKVVFNAPVNYASKRAPLTIADIDQDGKVEMIYSTGATGNIPVDSVVPFSDHSAWLMVLDNNLNFKFPPIEFKGEQKSLATVPAKLGGKYQLVSLLFDARSSSIPQRLFVHSIRGKLVSEVDIKGIGSYDEPLNFLQINNDAEQLLYIINRVKGDIYIFNKDYSLKLIRSFDERIDTIVVTDIDRDGQMEILFYKNDSKKICLADHEFNLLSETPLERESNYSDIHGGIIKGTTKNQLIYTQLGLNVFILELIPSVFYYKIVFFIGIYGGVFLVVFISQKVQSIILQRRKKVEDRINELQIKSTLNQLDPHFAFNVINTISTNILKDEKEKANEFLVDFSRLLRRSLEFSDKISWTLSNEIEFVKSFLKLQKARFGDLFNFTINIDIGIDQKIPLPKMILQGYVENAIKHGLRPKEFGGLLLINIEKEDNTVIISVEDNGIGRNESLILKKTSGTGKGNKLNSELVYLYNNLTNNNITLKIEDLVDSKKHALGTRVSIIIPIKS